jgi:hypothetical protein
MNWARWIEGAMMMSSLAVQSCDWTQDKLDTNLKDIISSGWMKIWAPWRTLCILLMNLCNSPYCTSFLSSIFSKWGLNLTHRSLRVVPCIILQYMEKMSWSEGVLVSILKKKNKCVKAHRDSFFFYNLPDLETYLMQSNWLCGSSISLCRAGVVL